MEWLGEFSCEALKRSVSSMLPWDIPWYDASHTIFFTALYSVLTIIGLGVLAAALLTLWRMRSGNGGAHH